MNRKRNNGFTMAETLIVVAIVLALIAIAFVGVARYRRIMRQLEFDGFAKEIFIAAQNHLTMAKNQGLLEEREKPGAECSEGADKEIYYLVYPGGGEAAADPEDKDSVLNLMLPIGAVDETVRIGGSYIIHYQKSSGRVLDVFFSSKEDQSGLMKNLGTSFTGSNYSSFIHTYSGDGNKAARRNCSACGGAVVGWYGGNGLSAASQELKTPGIRIINADKLTVIVNNPNKDNDIEQLKLHIKGLTSEKETVLLLSRAGFEQSGYSYKDSSSYDISVDLDDITTDGKHFAQLFSGLGFKPGEDLEIWAEADSGSALVNIAASAKLTTNSLFAYMEEGEPYTASIAYIRHLENLDTVISSFRPSNLDDISTSLKAKQISDMSWTEFRENTEGRAITFIGTPGATITADSYYPVNPTYKLQSYDGALKDQSGAPLSTSDARYKPGYSITGVNINTTGDAGLFAQIKYEGTQTKCEVSNLELIDFNVTSTGEGKAAGALAGEAVYAVLNNVLAHSTRGSDIAANGSIALGVSSKGDAGGLVGSMSGGCTVTDCAAALFVDASGNAGGLIGSSAGTTVENSYSGGHTEGGKYQNATTGQGQWNVKGGTAAGGLIGSSESDTLSGCYSTCSAHAPNTAATGQDPAAIAGGLIGDAKSTDITNCYATGLVSEGGKAFAGKVDSNVSSSGNLYFGAINPDMKSGDNDSSGSISASKSVYREFFFQNKTTQAMPYDSTLIAFYQATIQNKNQVYYPMKASGASAGHFAAAHYGDWPMPDALIYNE